MLILGIDTAGRRAGAALLDGNRLLATRSNIGAHGSALIPMIAELLASHGFAPSALDLIGVAQGPGTYTGLRGGVVTAKSLGRATGAVVLGVPTLEAMAKQAPSTARRVLVALHAYKKRMLCAWFERDDRGMLIISEEPSLMTAAEVPSAKRGEVVITDAADLLPELEASGAEVPVYEDSAVVVAQLALSRLEAGAEDEAYTLVPAYLRPPSITLKTGKKAVSP